MTNVSDNSTALPKPSLLRWEIGVALLIKIVLLTGLWFLIFRWQDKPIVLLYTRWVYKIIWGSITEQSILKDSHTLY